MKNLIIALFIFISLVTLQSCRGNDTAMVMEAQFLKAQTINIDGNEREFHIYIPEDPENKPLVLLLHGHGGSYDQSIGDDNTKAPQKVWLALAEQEDFIVIVPNGEFGSDDKRGWNDCRSDAHTNPNTDDVEFLSKLLDKAKSDYNHDVARVYIAGVSNGASMAIRLAQEIPERIAAFASIITTMPTMSECSNGTAPVSALFMNGTADPIAPYEGGDIIGDRGEVQSTEESVNYWVNRNDTDHQPIVEDIADIDQNDNSTVVKYTYPNGSNNTEVVLYKIIGGGHTEPSLEERYSRIYLAIVGEQNGDLEMADEIWNFFKTKSE